MSFGEAQADPPAGIEVRVDVPVAGTTSVTMFGELDHGGVEFVGPRLLLAASTSPGRFVVETSAITFVDSAGLRLLLRAHQAVLESGGEFSIEHPSGQMERLLALTGLEELIGAR